MNERDDPLSAHLFSLGGEKWRKLRNKFTPTFTSAKMKLMFPIMLDVAERFRAHLQESVKRNNELEMKEFCSLFTNDVIGRCAFGIECNSLENPNTEFRSFGRKLVNEPRHSALFLLLLEYFRFIGPLFRVKRVSDDVAYFYMKVARDTVEYSLQ